MSSIPMKSPLEAACKSWAIPPNGLGGTFPVDEAIFITVPQPEIAACQRLSRKMRAGLGMKSGESVEPGIRDEFTRS